MAFDYGSINLGLKNPFKLEGKTVAARGAIQTLIAIGLLVIASSEVKQDPISGWILMIFGMLTLGFGLKALATGIYATLRYFVGRNHPTSLAYNHAKSETSTAVQEMNDVAYQAKTLEEMLVGRKNSTFVEPIGFLARLLHSFLPKLLYMPYPIRNLTQRLFASWVSSLVGLIAYGFVAFVSLAGFAGEAGELAFPVYSVFLMLYILWSWRASGRPIERKAEHNIEALGSVTLAKVISLSFVLPILIGLALSYVMTEKNISKAQIDELLMQLPDFHAGFYLLATLLLAGICSVVFMVMLKARLGSVNPSTEVSELRENWQESVHPDEIFINLDNLVMANRRYKEVPNRVYKELDPQLQEQAEGKGGFKGEMIQEIQPKFRPLELGASFESLRKVALFGGNFLFLVAIGFSLLFAYALVDISQFVATNDINEIRQVLSLDNGLVLSELTVTAIHFVLIAFVVRVFAQLLSTCAHLFFAEMQFESLLVYFKCEGTFTESKISTGTGIHDSTRSENTLVRSSITPWVIVSKVVTSTFAATGIRNLEHPRHILEMHKGDDQLEAIKDDVVGFLKDRESIASITSERDLGNASQLYQLNQQTRANENGQGKLKEEEQGGYLRREEDLDK